MVSNELSAIPVGTRVRAIRMILPLIVLQLDAAAMLWILEATNQITEQTFALLLAVEMLAFAMVSYAYRNSKKYTNISKAWMIVGSVALLLLLFSTLIFTGN